MATPDFYNQSLWAAIMAVQPPLAAFAVIMIFLRKNPRLASIFSILTISVSLAGSLFLLVRHWGVAGSAVFTGRWMVSGEISIPFGFLIDPTSLLMLVIVSVICFLVQVYSLGYMAGDPGFARYYGFMSLFAWAMMCMTLSPTMLQLYVFWELVGLSSYLLIGFWYEKFSASEAGKKAFVMTRFGDVAFFLGLVLVLVHLGDLNILNMNAPDTVQKIPGTYLTLASILIFGGVIGKSAQFPLLTWLPDAMEGPTPVSALLHSATMVAAGVYLLARLFPFFSLSPAVMVLMLSIGAISMILASTMAMVSRDIKQVWAYSTISQLGFMIMGLAAGGFTAGVFHLTTHAGFKALLFLCAGVFIHTYHTNDMVEIGKKGGRTQLSALVCMIIGAGALSGLPPLSGFFSKEAIMVALSNHSMGTLWVGVGLVGIFLTAYYTFRLIFIICFPKTLDPEQYLAHGHNDVKMLVPLVVLAGITLVLGFFQKPLEAFLTSGSVTITLPVNGGHHYGLMAAALCTSLGGVVLAWFEFGRKDAAQVGFVEKIPVAHHLFANRWYIDWFYRWFLDHVIYNVVSGFCINNDARVIDGGIHALGRGVAALGRIIAGLHTALIQPKLMVVFSVVAIMTLVLCL